MGYNYQIKSCRWGITTSVGSYTPARRFDPPTLWDTYVYIYILYWMLKQTIRIKISHMIESEANFHAGIMAFCEFCALNFTVFNKPQIQKLYTMKNSRYTVSECFINDLLKFQ